MKAAHLEGGFIFGEGVGHGGGRRQHVPEVDGHAALPVQLRAHVHHRLRRLPQLQGRTGNDVKQPHESVSSVKSLFQEVRDHIQKMFCIKEILQIREKPVNVSTSFFSLDFIL